MSMYSQTSHEIQSTPWSEHRQPRTNPATNAPNAAQPYNDEKLIYKQKYQATIYKSDIYPEGLTMEWVQSHKCNKKIRNGQVPYQFASWSQWDAWYFTNNWFHRINDRVPFGKFCGWGTGLRNAEFYDQPYEGHLSYTKRPYDDNIAGQTIGGMMIGAQVGFVVGSIQVMNVATEANIYQSMLTGINRWYPIHKANAGFRARVVGATMVQFATILGGYQFFEGCLSQIRGTDDYWNALMGGTMAGFLVYGWFRNPAWTISVGTVLGAYMGFFRYRAPSWQKKPGFDIDKPLCGVLGGINNWIYAQEPNYLKTLNIGAILEPKYRTS